MNYIHIASYLDKLSFVAEALGELGKYYDMNALRNNTILFIQ